MVGYSVFDEPEMFVCYSDCHFYECGLILWSCDYGNILMLKAKFYRNYKI